jgi:SAM-dependent methyltransferase
MTPRVGSGGKHGVARSPGEKRLPNSMAHPELVVRAGWNRLSEIYRPTGAGSGPFHRSTRQYREWLRPLIKELDPGTPVLDLGCGTGEPASRELSKHFEVTGVDISDVMIKRARNAVPNGRFVRADMTGVRFKPKSFGAVVSLYAIIHVPLAKQKALFRRIHSWLTPHGLLLAVVGHKAWEGTEDGWLGSDVTMFWSHADAVTYRRWLREIGFLVLHEEFIREGRSGHELFLARKRAGD